MIGDTIASVLERKRAETEHEESKEDLITAEEKYRSIFENALEGIYQASPESRVRETRQYGSEGGAAQTNVLSLPL
ncbi:MAG: hypothetical protein AB2L11_13560 [Syntrophobacteraceae bacterium]